TRINVTGVNATSSVLIMSEELWVMARLYVVALFVMVAASLSLMIYLLTRSGPATPYSVITWINLALIMILSLMEVYVMAKINCAVWI
ncbi:MAG: hypothetical protein ACP5NQ_04120, partial [Vulcanisaeta sp.]